jgi:allophanate hydrolase subunit 2
MHQGIPPGGPLAPELLHVANASLGNDPNAAVLEIPNGATLVAVEPTLLSIDGALSTIDAGESLEIKSDELHYVGIGGGFDLPLIHGGRGTLLVARMGGLSGRYLDERDTLRGLGGTTTAVSMRTPRVHLGRIRVVPGPDEFPPAVLEALLSLEFRIGPSDRVGLRLTGHQLPVSGEDASGSRPMVRGAIQVTRDGTPIVLGPDHPTTGGYRVIACVVSDDWGTLARRRPGSSVLFQRAP